MPAARRGAAQRSRRAVCRCSRTGRPGAITRGAGRHPGRHRRGCGKSAPTPASSTQFFWSQPSAIYHTLHHLLHHRRRLHRHRLHVPLDHPRLPHRHRRGLGARPVVLVVAQLCRDRAALHHLLRVAAQARAGAAHRAGVRHRHRLQGRDRDRADPRGVDAHHLCGRQGRRSRRREAVLFARRHAPAGVPQARHSVLPAVDHLGAAGEYRARADRRHRRRVHRLPARPRPRHPLCRPDLRHRAGLGRGRWCSRRSPSSCMSRCPGSSACCARA